MLKYRTIRMIKQKAAQGKTAYAISQELGISKNTALRYMADDVPARPKYCRASKLEPFKPKIRHSIEQRFTKIVNKQSVAVHPLISKQLCLLLLIGFQFFEKIHHRFGEFEGSL